MTGPIDTAAMRERALNVLAQDDEDMFPPERIANRNVIALCDALDAARADIERAAIEHTVCHTADGAWTVLQLIERYEALLRYKPALGEEKQR